jgi:O-acetylhomoserine (thiol)-lyase
MSDDTSKDFDFDTLAVRAGVLRSNFNENAEALFLSSSFVHEDAATAALRFSNQAPGFVYSRFSNPTVDMFQARLAALEGGEACVATSSGMSAVLTTVMGLLKAGDHVVCSRSVFGAVITLFEKNLARFGLQTTFVEATDLTAWEKAVQPNTRMLFLETPSNPLMEVLDVAAVSKIAKKAGAVLVVDNCFCSPAVQRPLELGADIVVHSATKYMGGHGTSMGGVVVESGKFDWANGNFPEMTEPSRGYHGVRFYETFGDFGYTMKARMEVLRTFGPAIAPFNAWMLLQGLETLHVRMDRHVENAQKVAEFLEAHEYVSWVSYPGLKSNKYHELAKKYLPRGASAIMAFGVKGGLSAGEKFIEAAQFMSHLANIGDAKTLIIHPGSTTHRQLSEEEQIKAGVSPDMIRLSVGIENVGDILWDLDQALAASQKK